MYNKIINYFVLLITAFSLVSCSGFFDKDNTPAPTPLTQYREEVRPRLLWVRSTGYGTNKEYLKESPTIDGMTIFTASAEGTVTAVNKTNGRICWQNRTLLPITSGTGAGDGIVVVGTRFGDVQALRQSDGTCIWLVNVHGEVLAQPVIKNGVVIIKTVNGRVVALSAQDGHELWSYQQTEPNLVLRGGSTPVVHDNSVIAGFANGALVKLRFDEGELRWQQTIAAPEGAFAIQRMIDIDADPIVFQHQIYAATYQGKIAALSWSSGRIIWSQDISSYTGMVTDGNAIYISDAESRLWAFNADSGVVNWQQNCLLWRGITGPALMCNYIVVGDSEGYLHWICKRDGHLAGRVKIKGSIYSAPLVENNVLYVLTSSGYLAAYAI